MLQKQSVEIQSKRKGLSASEFTIRQVSPSHEEDSGWRFQAILKNESSANLSELEYALRYYDSSGQFVGLDEGFSLASDDLDKHEDKSVSIDLDIPTAATKGIFSIKAKKIHFLEKYNFLIFGVSIVVAAILFFLTNFIT